MKVWTVTTEFSNVGTETHAFATEWEAEAFALNCCAEVWREDHDGTMPADWRAAYEVIQHGDQLCMWFAAHDLGPKPAPDTLQAHIAALADDLDAGADMKPAHRAARVMAALLPVYEPDDCEGSFCDALADLQHAADLMGLDFDRERRRAHGHYCAEVQAEGPAPAWEQPPDAAQRHESEQARITAEWEEANPEA